MGWPGEFLFSTPGMAALFAPEAYTRKMLAFEAALARAEARAGVIPQEAAHAIALCCEQTTLDAATLYREGALAGTPAIPLVRMLTERLDGEARRYVHWGATSQDVIDSALMLQMRDGLDLLTEELLGMCAACARLAEQHRHTLMAGRTLLQQALPLTFGLKAARWLALMVRQVRTLRERRTRTLAVQLGGAVGTLASLGERGPRVLELLAEELGLPAPDLPWHTERDRVVEIATGLGLAAGAIAKVAHDIVLLAQTEVGEVREGNAPGKGGSSTLPQKHNPVDATFALAAARVASGYVPVMLSAMVQEHERAAGGWQAEWATMPDLFCTTASAAERVRHALETLSVDAERMRINLELEGGLLMAESLTTSLATRLGRSEAQQLVRTICDYSLKTHLSLRQAVQANVQARALLSSAELDQALDPGGYLGSANVFIDRALALFAEENAHNASPS